MEPTAPTTPIPPPTGDEDPAGPSLTGKTVGDFQILRRLGQGGMGQVYLAEQVSLKRQVALKVLRSDLARNETSLARFKAEAEAVARATHANIVQVYYIGTVDGLPFMALEYVEGKNLREYLAKKGPPEVPLALSIMRQVAAALVRAGELGIVHRDIKPDNILLTRKGEVKVADFGLSRVHTGEAGLHLTQSGVTMGTPLYMAPEQAEGKPCDCRADIYSFGVTCYHMLAGEPPFKGATAVEVALQHISGRAAPLAEARPDLPAPVCALVHRMMARRPEDRFQTARDLLREIVRLRDGVSGAVPLPASLPSVDVEPVHTLADGTGGGLAAVASSATAAAVDVSASPPWSRWWSAALFAVSIVVAAVAGVALARVRHSPGMTAAHGSSGDPADAETLPLDDEPALRRAAEIYLAAGPGKDVSVGMSLCVKLAILYFDQHRLDEADKVFTRLDGIDKVQSYHLLGRLGRGIVLALQDQPAESNKLFREVAFKLPHREAADPKGTPRRPDGEMVRVLQTPAFLYWLAQAVRYNHVNGLPDDQVPAPLRRLLELKRQS
jgi:eukaryotic-like serine/threonine-protein kinase